MNGGKIRYWAVAALCLLAACGDKPKQIPEHDLKNIIKESLIAENYVFSVRLSGNVSIRDTFNYYLPVLEKYGYTMEDMEYTVQKYAQRKTDVLSKVINDISEEIEGVRERYADNNRKRLKGVRLVEESVQDTVFRMSDSIRIRDKKKLNLYEYYIPLQHDGTYEVNLKYRVMPSDSNNVRYMRILLDDSLSERRGEINNVWLPKVPPTKGASRDIEVKNVRKTNRMTIHPTVLTTTRSEFYSKYSKRLDMVIDTLTVVYRPPLEVAGDILFIEQTGLWMLVDLQRKYPEAAEVAVPFRPGKRRFPLPLNTPYLLPEQQETQTTK